MSFYSVGNFQEAVLSAACDPAHTSITIQALLDATSFVSPTSLAILSKGRDLASLKNGEIVIVTGKTGWTYDITRPTALGDRTSWPAGTLVLGNFFAEHLEQITDAMSNLQWATLYALGGSDSMQQGIVRTGSYDDEADFKIKPTSGVNNSITVWGGMAIIAREPVHVDQTTQTVINLDTTAGADDYGIFIHTSGVIDASTGYSPGGTYTDKMILGVVTTDTTARQLVTGDIDDERQFF